MLGPEIFHKRFTGKWYLEFLQNHVIQMLEDVSLHIRVKMIFQHDRASPHNRQETNEHLQIAFVLLNDRIECLWILVYGMV